MTASSNMLITHMGLSKIAQRVIEQRVFKRDDVTLTGHPLLTENGILGAISRVSYAECTGIDFINEIDSLNIKFKGVIKGISDKYQTCFTLVHESNPDFSISVCLNKTSMKVLLGNTQAASIPGFPFKENDIISFNLTLATSWYEITTKVNGEIRNFAGDIDPSLWDAFLVSAEYKKVYMGYNPRNTDNFWYGTIDISEFIIDAHDWDWDYEYAPSYNSSFYFTKVLVSDGEKPLTDTSIATYKHIFEFPVTWGRAGQCLLFTAEIDKETYLTIREIGLYFTVGGKEYLFSSASGFPPLQKIKDIGYNLTFILKMGFGVWNCWIFPDIVVKEGQYSKLSDLEKLKLIHAYIVTDMERAINNNATLIGYEADEVFLQMFNQTRFISDNYIGTQQYAKIRQNICPKETRVFDKERIDIMGEPYISGSLIRNFSSDNYAIVPISADLGVDWEIELSFQIPRSTQMQSIFCACSPYKEPKLTLGTDNSGSVYVKTNTGVQKRLFKIDNLKKTFVKIKYSGTAYTFYKRLEEEPGYTKVGETTSETPLGEVGYAYLGVYMDGGATSNPLIGTIDMKDIIIYSDGVDYSPSIVTYRYIELEDFYHFIDYPSSFYKIKNLKPMGASTIAYIDGSITGGIDSIDFGTMEGGSLVLTVDFVDRKNKLILAKRKIEYGTDPETNELRLEHDDYFTLEFINYTLIATVHMNNEIVELRKEYDIDTCSALVDKPVTITITSEYSSTGGIDEPSENEEEVPLEELLEPQEPVDTYTFRMYINNEKVAEESVDNPEFPVANLYKLTNYETVPSEASENYVLGIADFDGTLNEDEIRYLCTILGTNG